MQTYYEATNEELFKVMPTEVQLQLMDAPGRPRSRVICEVCGEGVNDGREVYSPETRAYCQPCAVVFRNA